MANNELKNPATTMTTEEISEKFNGGRRIINFTGKSKIYFCISLGIILIGIICLFIFNVTLDIQFSGGATLTYSYKGDINHDELHDFIQEKTTKDTVSTSFSSDMAGNTGNNVTVQFPGNEAIDKEIGAKLTTELQKQFPDAEFALLEENSVDPSMGFSFLLKCLVAVGIASLLMVLYVALRFRKIGGFSAGVFALVALFHDVAMIFFMYVIFRWPIDSNFIAVVLMILGYSLNDTIVIYDRVREQRKLMGRKVGIDTVFNVSATKTIKRTIMTSVTTLVAILTVFIVASVFNISSVKGFALPMMIGVISGCYSSICIAGPLWVIWQNRKAKK